MKQGNNLYNLAKRVNLSGLQCRAVNVLASCPDLSQTEAAAMIGVSRFTLFRWRKSPLFQAALQAAIQRQVPFVTHSAIIEKIVAGALSGDHKMQRMYLKWRGKFDIPSAEAAIQSLAEGTEVSMESMIQDLHVAGDVTLTQD